MVKGFHAEIGNEIFFVALQGKSGPIDRNDRMLLGPIPGRALNPMMLFTEGTVTTGNLSPGFLP